jgi:Flp pilus assembly protein TadD
MSLTTTPTTLRLQWAHSLFDHGDFAAAATALAELVTELEATTPVDGQSAAPADTAGALHGTTDLRLMLARAYFGSAQLGRAEATLRRLVDEAPDDGYVHLLLGRTLQRQGRHDDARRHLSLAEVLGDYARPSAYGEQR